MTRSKVTLIADFPINGNQVGAWFDVQRIADGVGALQIVVDLPGNVTGGSLLLLGRSSTDAPGSAIHNIFLTATLQAATTIERDIRLQPQMSARLVSGVSAPEARVQVYLME